MIADTARRWQLYSRENLDGLVASEPDACRKLRFSPFVTLPGMFRAGLADGAFILGGPLPDAAVPFARAPLRGLSLGGYLHSEITAIGSGCLDWRGLHSLLTVNGIIHVRGEAPETDTAFFALGEYLKQQGWRVEFYPGKRSPYLDFPESREPDGFCALLREASAKEYRNLRASRRKMEAAHAVAMEFLRLPADEALAARLGAVDENGWKKDLGIFSGARKAATLALFGDTVLNVGLLYLDGALAAWDIDVREGDTVYSYNRSYDARHASLAPGKILHYETLRHAYDEGVSRVHIMGGADALKMRFATGTVQRVHMRAFSPGIAGNVLRRCLAAKRTLGGALRRVRGYRK